MMGLSGLEGKGYLNLIEQITYHKPQINNQKEYIKGGGISESS